MALAIKLNVKRMTFRVLGAVDEYTLRKCIEDMEKLGYKWEE